MDLHVHSGRQSVLITGVHGCIGMHLWERMRNHYDVWGLDENAGPCDNFVHGDLCDPQSLAQAFQGRPVAVFHLAGRPGVRWCEENADECWRTNVLGTALLVEEAARHECVQHFIFASSSTVYGDAPVPWSEAAVDVRSVHHASVYARSKRMGEHLVSAYASPRLRVTICRLFSVYGPRLRPDMAPAQFLQRIHSGANVHMHGDASRDFTFIDDVVVGFERCLARGGNAQLEVVNFAHGCATSIGELVSIAERLLDKRACVVAGAARPEDLCVTHADTAHATRIGVGPFPTPVAAGMRAAAADMLASQPLFVVALIATCPGRRDLLQRALDSVAAQTREPDLVVVVLDVPEREVRDALELDLHRRNRDVWRLRLATVDNTRTAQCASGSWNSGIMAVLHACPAVAPALLFIAVLDDDDAWRPHHLAQCVAPCRALPGADVVVSGILRVEDAGSAPKELSVPVTLSAAQFLVGNPHVQGSNLFIRLSVLLQAGLFDENLPSCTDRDLMIRILDLGHVRVACVPACHSVVHYAESGRARLSSPLSASKSVGLARFFGKYRGRMTGPQREAFLARAQSLFGWEPTAIVKVCAPVAVEAVQHNHVDTEWVVVGITSDSTRDTVAPLLGDLLRVAVRLVVVDVVILENGPRGQPVLEAAVTRARQQGLRCSLISLEEQARDHHVFPSWMERDGACRRRSIAETRTMLQYYCFGVATHVRKRFCLRKDALVLILDDDKRLSSLPLTRVDSASAVLGCDVLTPPLPAASMIRTQAVDVLHNWQRLLSGNADDNNDVDNNSDMADYYHDLSATQFAHLERPSWMRAATKEAVVDGFQRALHGCAVMRPLTSGCVVGAQRTIERGGSTLVFDLQMLLVPNSAPRVGGRFSRRSDMLWAARNAEQGRTCVRSGEFLVTHERSTTPTGAPVFSDLARSMLDDVVGAASVRGLLAFQQHGHYADAADAFSVFLLGRVSQLRASVHRVYGVVQCIRSLERDAAMAAVCDQAVRLYDPEMWDAFLTEFVFDRCSDIQREFDVWLRAHQQHVGDASALCEVGALLYAHHRKAVALQHLRREMPAAAFEYVSMGGEGVVFRSGATAFKYLDGFAARGGQRAIIDRLVGAEVCAVLNVPLLDYDGGLVMRSKFVAAAHHFPNGADRAHLMRQIFDFVGECRRLRIVCNNVSQSNFLVTDKGGLVRFVDFGIDICEWTAEGETCMLRRLLLLLVVHDHNNLVPLMRNSATNALMPQLSELPLFVQALEAHLNPQVIVCDSVLHVGANVVRNPFFDESAPPMHALERAVSRAGLRLAAQPRSVPGVSVPDLLPVSPHLLLSLKPQCGAALPPSSLVIRACAMDARSIYCRVVHLVRSLLAPCDLGSTERVVIFDAAKTDDFVRSYDESQMELLREQLARLQTEQWIDRVVMATAAGEQLYEKWFGVAGQSQSHALDGTTIALGLQSIDCAQPESELVLLVDCDIMVGRTDPEHSLLREACAVFAEDAQRVAWAVNVYGCHVFPVVAAARFESRASVVHRARLLAKLPLTVGAAPFSKGYHRLLDRGGVASVRGGHASAVYFVHPSNEFKRHHCDSMLALAMIERAQRLPACQLGKVDLCFDVTQPTTISDMLLARHEPLVVVVCGRVTPGQFWRCMQSLEQQTFRRFGVVCIDDANESQAAREFIRRYADEKRLAISLIQPYARRGSLANHVLAIRSVCHNAEAIICSVDADDWLADEHVLQRVWDVYAADTLVEVAVGGMHRTDKDRTYAVTFRDARHQRGSNVWSHLKTFRKHLFDRIRDADLRSAATGAYFDLASDWAMMLPMVEMATRCAEFTFPTYIYNGTSLNRLARSSRIDEIVSKPAYARRRFSVAVVGHARLCDGDDEPLRAVCVELGRLLAAHNFVIVNGGLGGVMEHVARGARQCGDVVGVVPGSDPRSSNPFVSVALATSLEHARNAVVALADAMVVVGGGAGTLSEVALAWSNRRLVVALPWTGGTAAQVAGRPLDSRVRYRDMADDDKVFAADSAAQVVALLEQKLPLYGRRDRIK